MDIAMIAGRAARALLGWTQERLSTEADISERALRSVEGEGAGTTVRTYQKLQEALEGTGVTFTMTEAGVGVFLSNRAPRFRLPFLRDVGGYRQQFLVNTGTAEQSSAHHYLRKL